MANVTFTIPDADVPDYIAAYSTMWNAQSGLTQAQFAKQQAAAYLAQAVAEYRKRQAEAQINIATPQIT